MKILLISKYGEGLGLAYRMAKENNDVKAYVKQPGYEFTGLGLIDMVTSFRPELKWAEFVICDSTGFSDYVELFKEHKIPTLGLNKMADILDGDPVKVNELGEKFGFKTPKVWKLKEPSSGVELLSDWNERGLVVKTKEAKIVCKDKETYFWVLSKYAPTDKISVQEYIPGTPFTVEGWFNGVTFMSPYFLIDKELGSTDNTLKQHTLGTAVIKFKRGKIVDDTLKKLEPFLKKISYRGPINVNCVLNRNDIYVISVNPKLCFDSIEALAEGLTIPLSDFLYKVVTTGKDYIEVVDDYMISVRLTTPCNINKFDMPIKGIVKDNENHLFMNSVFQDEDGQIRYSAANDIVAKVTARGRDMGEAMNRAYRTINNIEFLDKRYYPNVGRNAEKNKRELGAAGYV